MAKKSFIIHSRQLTSFYLSSIDCLFICDNNQSDGELLEGIPVTEDWSELLKGISDKDVALVYDTVKFDLSEKQEGETICFKLPTIEQVEFRINAEQDDISVRGNAVVSGDDKYDKRIEDGILRRLDRGDIWAWASVEVIAEYKGYSASDFLGACSYKNEKDFIKNSGYYEDMKQRAYEELIEELKKLQD